MTPPTPIRERWRGTMTDRERFNNQMHYRPVDRCFNMEFGYWNENFTRWKLFVDNDVHDNAAADVLFNFDTIDKIDICIWMNPVFEERVVDETETGRILVNVDGLLAEVPKDDHDTIPHYIKATVEKPDDWKRCKEERFRLDDPARVIDVEALKRQHPPDRAYPLGVPCGSMIGRIRNMLIFEGLAYAQYDYPDMVEHGLDQVLGEIDFDYAFGWEGISFKSGPIVSLDFFERVVVPRYRRIGDKLNAHGSICGTPTATAPSGRCCRDSWRRASIVCSRMRSTAARTRLPCCRSTERTCAS